MKTHWNVCDFILVFSYDYFWPCDMNSADKWLFKSVIEWHSQLLPLYSIAIRQLNEWVWRIGGMILTRAKQSTQRKPCPTAPFSTTNNMWTDVGSNLGLHGVWPTTNCLSQGVVYVRSVLATCTSSLCAATEQKAEVQQAAASHNTQNVHNCGCLKLQLQFIIIQHPAMPTAILGRTMKWSQKAIGFTWWELWITYTYYICTLHTLNLTISNNVLGHMVVQLVEA